MNTARIPYSFARWGVIAAVLAAIGIASPAGASGWKYWKWPHLSGTYLTEATIGSAEPGPLPPFLSPGLETQSLMVLHADGTVSVRHNFGPPAVNIEPAFGVWKRTGQRSMKVVYMLFNTPRIADPTSTDPEINNFTGRITIYLTVDKEFGIAEGTGVNEAFYAAQDPLDPDEVPVARIHFTVFNARRMHP